MADHIGAAEQRSPHDSVAVPEVVTENKNDDAEHYQPFFSLCQPLRSVSYSNSWEGVCAPAANEIVHISGFNSMDHEHMQIASCTPGNKQSLPEDGFDVPDGETNEQPEPLCTVQPSSNDEIDLWDAKANEQLFPLNIEQCNSNIGADTCANEEKRFALSFSCRRQPQSVGAGLSNMGNTCFLNATLQCITHTVPLFLKLRSTDHSTPCSYNEDGFCSFCALKEHVDESVRRSGSVIMPAKFRHNLKKLSSDFRPGQQEDAHEFLRCFLDNLHRCTLVPGSKGNASSFDEESLVKEIFGGQLKSQLSCCECGHCSETFEPFLDLSLEIDQVDHLVDALESFTKVEQIGDSEDKLTCEHCTAQVCKNKQLTLEKAPDVIAFQLKRFTTLDNSIEKIDKHVVYPPELDLKPFHSNTDAVGELKYDLYGIVEHSGLPNYGHYVCTIRSSPSSWYLMNDSHVDSISDASALNQEAYILFYVRQGKYPWFSSLLEGKDAQYNETTRGASPVSVLENIDANCSSSGEGTSSSSGDRLEKNESSHCNELEKDEASHCNELEKDEASQWNEFKKDETSQCNEFKKDETSQCNELKKDETSHCKSSFIPENPSKRSLLCASNSYNIQDETGPCRPSLQNDASGRYVRAVGNTNMDRPSTPPRPKRLSSNSDLHVFEFEEYDDEETTPLLPNLKFQSKVKKAKAASASKAIKGPCVDQNAVRLMRSMPASRRNLLIDCIAQQNAEQKSRRCPASDPLDKKKRKLVSQY